MRLNQCVYMRAQLCLTLRPHGLYPARLHCPWNSPGKNTGVGCHFTQVYYTFFYNKLIIGSEQGQLKEVHNYCEPLCLFLCFNEPIHRENFAMTCVLLDELFRSEHAGNHDP